MKKAIIAIVVIIIIVLAIFWMRGGTGYSTAIDDTSFENDAAAILAAKVPDQQKLANLQTNLDARVNARKGRAAKVGAVSKNLPVR